MCKRLNQPLLTLKMEGSHKWESTGSLQKLEKVRKVFLLRDSRKELSPPLTLLPFNCRALEL